MVEKNREYVQAARVIGVSPLRIMRKHVLPNVLGPVLVLATIHVATAIQTSNETPNTRVNERPSTVWSLTGTALPPRISVAAPIPAKPMPRLAIIDGMRSTTCTRPLTRPSAAPAATASGKAARPQSLSLTPLATSTLRITAPMPSTPSTERSMLPIRMTKVMPQAMIIGIAAALASRLMLPWVRNAGWTRPISTQSSISTPSGTTARSRTRSAGENTLRAAGAAVAVMRDGSGPARAPRNRCSRACRRPSPPFHTAPGSPW